MSIFCQFRAAATCAIFLALIPLSRAEEEIRSYTVPKEATPPSDVSPSTNVTSAMPSPGSAMPATDIPVSATPVHWTTPAGWKELAPNTVRIGNFAVTGPDGTKADVGVFSFPGSVGTELENVNRWRHELDLPPIEENEIASEAVTIDGLSGRLYDIVGASHRTMVASLPRHGATWYFKLRGDAAAVAQAKGAFHEFLNSVRFSEDAATAAETAPPVTANEAEGPKWDVPANWTAQTPGTMIFKSFAVAGKDDTKATVNISFFPGDVGGTFANVNRWRGQLGLPPVDEGRLVEVTHVLQTSAGPATLVDFTGSDPKSRQAARLVGAIVPHGDSTWFYKLTGNDSTVGQEKETFVKFVQSVHYP